MANIFQCIHLTTYTHVTKEGTLIGCGLACYGRDQWAMERRVARTSVVIDNHTVAAPPIGLSGLPAAPAIE